MGGARIRRLTGLVAVILAGLAAAAAGPLPQASAASVDPAYHGGQVIQHAQVYTVFWGWTSDQLNHRPAITALMQGLGGSNYLNTLTTYCSGVPTGSTSCPPDATHIENPVDLYAGSWDDPLPTTTYGLGQEVSRFYATHPAITPSSNTFVIVLLPQGASSTPCGAAHSSQPINGVWTGSAGIPYCDVGVDTVASTTQQITHELGEAMADPLNENYQGMSGWWVQQWGSFGEIGDACDSHNGYVTLSTGRFYVNGLWDLARKACNLDQWSATGWGTGWSGQLGNGSTSDATTPVPGPALSGITSIAGGWGTTTAARSDGTVWSWGTNNWGALGTGVGGNGSMTPVQAAGLSNITAVATGMYAGYALGSNSAVYAWGKNTYGEVGTGTPDTVVMNPTPVANLYNTTTAIAAGTYTAYALRYDGTVRAWGYNADGELGNGTTTNSTTPVPVTGLTNVVAIAAGPYTAYALKSDGTVWSWGANWTGELGNGTTWASSTVPVQVIGLTGVIAIAGGDGGYALKSGGTVWAWGTGTSGDLGNGTTTNSKVPVQVSGLSGVTAIAATKRYAYRTGYALKPDGTVYAWGYNADGELGSGTTTNVSTPTQIAVTGAYSITGGFADAFILK